MTAEEHNRTLGILFLVYFGMQVLGFIISIAVMFVTLGMMSGMPNGDKFAIGLLRIIFGLTLILGVILTIPSGVAGFKLFKQRSNARIWAIIASIVGLINLPFGTALGIYGLWFLFSENGKLYYLADGTGTYFPPPPPENWR